MLDLESERNRLEQAETLREFQREWQSTEMVVVYERGQSFVEVNCLLLPEDQVEKACTPTSWYIDHQAWGPEVKFLEACESQIEYLRFGNYEGLEPLVIPRNFHDIRPDCLEISEEFRLFHNLYYDCENNHYTRIDELGNEDRIVVVEPGKVMIRLRELRLFLTAKNMHLAIQFDRDVWSKLGLGELGLTEGQMGKEQHKHSWWKLSYGDTMLSQDRKSFSRFLGIRLIAPLPPSQSGILGVAEETEKEYVEFITGMDDNGKIIKQSCAPSAMAAKPGDYLIPVSFRKTVLGKYYQYPTKFRFSNGAVWCGSLWGLRVDDHHDEKVVVLLGDLGDLPYEEQLLWRAHNFADQEGFSETYYRSQFLAEITSSERPEHLFHSNYRELEEVCRTHLGWPLLLPLNKGDEYHLQNIRIPASNEQQDFDGLVLGLTKILVDSLNEKCLKNLTPVGQRQCINGSISWLEASFSACGVSGANLHVDFLRNLQSLRSAGSAHRKGRNYRNVAARFGLGGNNLRTVFAAILKSAVLLLKYLIDLVRSQRLRPIESH